MAKDVNKEDDDDKFDKMDDESLEFLDQVRKSKARNFVLSMKGNKVRSLLVKKKPIKEKDRKAAKGEGFQPIFGVASGSGAQITFSVARSDGFDEKARDRKTDKLKKFLNAQTGKVFKPTFELVDAPPPIAFDDEDLDDPLIARFMKMAPVINKACDAHPDSVPEIQSKVEEIRILLQDEETRQSAGPKMDELVVYLKDLLSKPPTTAAGEDPAALFKARLTALVPGIKKAVGAAPGDEAKLKASEAGVLARKNDFVQANALLDRHDTLMQEAESLVDTAVSDADFDATLAKIEEAEKLLEQVQEASN